jgi:hypothetical protein
MRLNAPHNIVGRHLSKRLFTHDSYNIARGIQRPSVIMINYDNVQK